MSRTTASSRKPIAGTHTYTCVLGTEVFHQEMGAGEPLVLLHGLNDSHRTWRSILPELSRTRRVLVPDLPGCGLSGRPDACYSLDWQAKVILAWLGALGIESTDFVGHSYGGGVAQYMLLLEPKRIRRLALVAAGGLGREVAFELRLASLPWIVERFGQPFMGPVASRALRGVGGMINADEDEWLREVNARPGTARAFSRTVRDVINWRGQTRHFLDRAREIEVFPPVALFWGSADRVIPHAQALATLKLLRGAELTTFDGSGHFPHHDQPAELARELLAFFSKPEARPVHCVVPERSVSRSLSNMLVACRRALGLSHGRLAA